MTSNFIGYSQGRAVKLDNSKGLVSLTTLKHLIITEDNTPGLVSGSYQTLPLTHIIDDPHQNLAEIDSIKPATNIISNGIIPLKAGTYVVEGIVSFDDVGQAKTRLRSDDNSIIILGTNVETHASSINTGHSFIFGQFTITENTEFHLEGYCETTSAADAFGTDSPSTTYGKDSPQDHILLNFYRINLSSQVATTSSGGISLIDIAPSYSLLSNTKPSNQEGGALVSESFTPIPLNKVDVGNVVLKDVLLGKITGGASAEPNVINANLELQLRASDIEGVSVDATPATWTCSENGYEFTVGSTPTFQTDSVEFDGTDDRYSTTDATLLSKLQNESDAFTLYFIVDPELKTADNPNFAQSGADRVNTVFAASDSGDTFSEAAFRCDLGYIDFDRRSDLYLKPNFNNRENGTPISIENTVGAEPSNILQPYRDETVMIIFQTGAPDADGDVSRIYYHRKKVWSSRERISFTDVGDLDSIDVGCLNRSGGRDFFFKGKIFEIGLYLDDLSTSELANLITYAEETYSITDPDSSKVPNTISDLDLWLRSSTGVNASTWTDQSSNAYSLTATGTPQVTNNIVVFNGSSYYRIATSDFNPITDLTIFIVYRSTNDTPSEDEEIIRFSEIADTTSYTKVIANNTSGVEGWSSKTDNVNSFSASDVEGHDHETLGNYKILRLHRYETAIEADVDGNTYKSLIFKNGILTNRDSDFDVSNTTFDEVVVGDGLIGEIKEIIVYTRNLEQSECEHIENYLAAAHDLLTYSGAFELTAGTYRIFAVCCTHCGSSTSTTMRLRNLSTGEILGVSDTLFIQAGECSTHKLLDSFTLSQTSLLSLEIYINDSASNGLGQSFSSPGDENVYSYVSLWREENA